MRLPGDALDETRECGLCGLKHSRVADAIRDRAKAGEAVADIAEDYGTSRSVVRRVIATEPHK